mgnify:CR=1 FL=1|tara:strand:+ start:1214 stop:1993 length:780 start_codon:yes stop_codon:yes gene_type:complete
MKYNLLSDGKTNHKIKKNIKENYNTYSLNFAHSDLSGFNVCPKANKLTEQEDNKKKSNCSSCCVGFNGNASIFSSVMESRIKKTLSYFLDKDAFYTNLIYEVNKAIEESKKLGLKPSFRLNAYSDIRFEKDIITDAGKNIFDLFPDIDFYDYTKVLNRKTPKNYQLTFSHHNADFIETTKALESGLNVAMVFEKLPKSINVNGVKYDVVNGDKTDLRLDEKVNNKNVVVGLKFKGSKEKLNKAILEGFCLDATNDSLNY